MQLTIEKTLKDRTREMIESDPDVSRWVNNLRSESAKRIYSEGLLKYSEYAKQSPKEIAQGFQINKKIAEDILTDFICSLRDSKKFTPKTINNHLVSVRSWLSHNEVEIKRKIYCGNTKSTPTIEDETVPSQDELNRIMQHTDLRGRAAISLIAFAGLRLKAASSIILKDLPEIIIDGENTRCAITPTMIKVKAELSKNGNPYFTFLSTEGCSHLIEYLRARFRQGEILTKESKVLNYGKQAAKHSLSRKGYSKKISRTFDKAGFHARPYVLRSYFDTALTNGRLSHNFEKFIMGHVGDMTSHYCTRKNLNQDTIEEMRKQFKELAEPKLQTISIVARNEIEELKAEKIKSRQKIAELEAKLSSLGVQQSEILGFLNLNRKALEIIRDNASIDQLPPSKRQKIVNEITQEVKEQVRKDLARER